MRNTSTNEQRLLLSQPAQVVSLSIPDAKCAAGEGDTPCGMLLWVIRDKDTNHDGVVNFKDADTLYASELSAKTLNRLSPADATVLDWTWDALSGEVLMQIRRDVNHDGEFSDADGSEVVSAKVPGVAEGTSILRTDLLQQLQRVVE